MIAIAVVHSGVKQITITPWLCSLTRISAPWYG